MKIHGRELPAHAKVDEVPCEKGCQGGTHVDVVWLPPGKREGQVIGLFYVSHGKMVAAFDAQRRPAQDCPTADLSPMIFTRADDVPDKVEAWEVRWRWADEPALKNSRLN